MPPGAMSLQALFFRRGSASGNWLFGITWRVRCREQLLNSEMQAMFCVRILPSLYSFPCGSDPCGGVATILAKIMWDTLAVLQNALPRPSIVFTWKQTFFGPNSTFLLSPVQCCSKGKAFTNSRSTLHRGEGEEANIAGIRHKRQSVPQILPRIVARIVEMLKPVFKARQANPE